MQRLILKSYATDIVDSLPRFTNFLKTLPARVLAFFHVAKTSRPNAVNSSLKGELNVDKK